MSGDKKHINLWLAETRSKYQTKYRTWVLAHKDESNTPPNFMFTEEQGYPYDACGCKLSPEQVQMVAVNADLLKFDCEFASD